MIFFTSDTHYNHKNIVRGTSTWKTFEEGSSHQKTRDFDTLEEHNEALVKAINDVVGVDDQLWHLGDWSFGGFPSIKQFRDRLVVRDINLVYGNHDEKIEANREGIQSLFTSVQYYKELTIQGHKLILSHYAHRVWNKSHHNSIHLYGHSHGTIPDYGKSMDVGVDVAFNLFGEYRPFRWEEIARIMAKRQNLIVDHHTKHTN
jgi:calcineurin-like phosphoesterase family protein